MPPPFYRNSKVINQKFDSVSVGPTDGDISKANIADEISRVEREKEFSVVLTAIR